MSEDDEVMGAHEGSAPRARVAKPPARPTRPERRCGVRPRRDLMLRVPTRDSVAVARCSAASAMVRARSAKCYAPPAEEECAMVSRQNEGRNL